MIRPAYAANAPEIEAFLAGHAHHSMFLRANLAAHGIGAGTHAMACRFWRRDAADGLAGDFALTGGGIALLQMPGATDEIRAGLRRVPGAALVSGMNGPADRVARARHALGLEGTGAPLDRVAPLMVLSLEALRRPDGPGQSRAPHEGDMPLPGSWRAACNRAVPGATDGAAAEAGARSGAREAVLFAADVPARRSYAALGFAAAGAYHLIGFAPPRRLAAA